MPTRITQLLLPQADLRAFLTTDRISWREIGLFSDINLFAEIIAGPLADGAVVALTRPRPVPAGGFLPPNISDFGLPPHLQLVQLFLPEAPSGK